MGADISVFRDSYTARENKISELNVARKILDTKKKKKKQTN
jgi:hypothetical protein